VKKSGQETEATHPRVCVSYLHQNKNTLTIPSSPLLASFATRTTLRDLLV